MSTLDLQMPLFTLEPIKKNRVVKETRKNGVKGVFTTIGAANFREYDREQNDFYATDPKAVEELLKVQTFSKRIWECACGTGHISNVLIKHGYDVKSSDLIDRGFGEQIDFLDNNIQSWDGDIITNPPYKLALEFVKKANEIITVGHKVAMFLKLTFLESKSRKEYFAHTPPQYVYVFSERQSCALGGDFETHPQSAIAFAWFIWTKGIKDEPKIRWI